MKNELTAIFVVALVAFGGIGIGMANPDDVMGFDTPQERAGILVEKLADQKQSIATAVLAGQITAREAITLVISAETAMKDQLRKYVRMYNLIYNDPYKVTGNDDEATPDVVIPNLSFTYNGYTFNLGTATFKYNAYDCNIEVVLTHYILRGCVTEYALDSQVVFEDGVSIEVIWSGHVFNIPGPVVIGL